MTRVTHAADLYEPFDDDTKYENTYSSSQDGLTRTMTLKFKNLRPEDSGFYICEVIYRSKHYQLIHELRVVGPTDDMTAVLTGVSKTIDHTTDMGDTGSMIYYNNTMGTIRCEVCDGAAKPIIRVHVGDQDVTARLKDLTENFTMSMNGETGMKKITRCVSRSSTTFELAPSQNRKPLKCIGHTERSDGSQINEKSVTRTVFIYHPAQKVSEAECPAEQSMPLNGEGWIQCKVRAIPGPTLVQYQDIRTRKVYKVSQNDDWTMTNVLNGDTMVVKLAFKKVTNEQLNEYYLIVQNKAGRKSIRIRTKQGISTVGKVRSSSSLVGTSGLLALLSSLLLILFS